MNSSPRSCTPNTQTWSVSAEVVKSKPSPLKVFSWVLYDFSNTIYSMNVVTMYFSLWVTVNLAREDLWVSLGNSVSMFLAAISLPILGAISDSIGRRMPFLLTLTLVSVCGTMMIGVIGYCVHNPYYQILLAVLAFIIANYAYQGGLVFYNALLPEVTTPDNIGRISGYGVAMGYLGAIVGLLMVLPFAQGEISFLNLSFRPLQGQWQSVAYVDYQPQNQKSLWNFLDTKIDKNANYRYQVIAVVPKDSLSHRVTIFKSTSRDTVITLADRQKRAVMVSWMLPSNATVREIKQFQILRQKSGWGRVGIFIPTAILFLLFSIPTFLFVKESRRGVSGQIHVDFQKAFRDVVESLSNTKKYPGVLRFLIAKFFYEEGIQTAIIFMAVYAVKVMGFPNNVLIPFFIVTTTAAIFGSFFFGFVTDRLGPKHTLLIVIVGWIICLWSLIAANDKLLFWILGSLIGVFLGSTWTSARPLLVSLVPEEKLAEFFGLYALSGKTAAIIGPWVWGLVVFALHPYGDQIKYRAAVFALSLMMFIGFVLLFKVPGKRFQK